MLFRKEKGCLIPEAATAYTDGPVLRALRDISWFTQSFIVDVHDHEPEPEMIGLGPYKDKLLNDFFSTLALGKVRGAIFQGIRGYLTQRIVGPEGHPRLIGGIEFVDQEFLEYAQNNGATPDYEFDRGMIHEIDYFLQCLIAPVSIRRKVVKICCNWDESAEERKKDVLLFAELIKKGALKYSKERI